MIVLYGNLFVISLLHFSAGPISRQEESVWFTICGAWCRIGANCVSRSLMYINRIRICGATLTLPAPVAAGWSKFFTSSDSFDPNGRHNNLPDSSKERSVAWLTPKPHHFNLDQQRQWWWTGSCGDFGAWYCITEKARVTWQGRPIIVLHSNSSSSSRREVPLVVMFP